MWLMGSVLFAVGATVGAISLIVPHPASFDDGALWTNIALSYAGAVFCLVVAGRFPVWPLYIAVAIGIFAVTRAAYYSGDPTGFYALFYVWIGLYAVFFFSRQAALAYLVGIGLAYAWLLAHFDISSGLARWITVIGTVGLGAILIDSLVKRVRRIARDYAALAAEREQLMTTLAEVARTDELTGLANRRAWDEGLERELQRARRDSTPLCVGLIDLDRFKAYNDLHGHQAGDRLLKELASNWGVELRASDFLARYGGEEFALALPGCDLEDGRILVERLRAATPAGETCSAGLAVWDGSEAGEALLGRADAALYHAKEAGRDRVVAA
jgi:diguanylate cyclase (GGDEF)-like protein